MLVFGERGKQYPEKNLSERCREPTNPTHFRRRVGESHPDHMRGSRALTTTPSRLHKHVDLVILGVLYRPERSYSPKVIWQVSTRPREDCPPFDTEGMIIEEFRNIRTNFKLCGIRISLTLACSRLLVSEDDQKSEQATSGISCERDPGAPPLCLPDPARRPPAFSIVHRRRAWNRLV